MDKLKLTRQELEARTKELAEAKRRLEITLRELTHRSKNLLTVINAIARQTAARTRSIDDFLDRFGARLYAIGISHDLLVSDDWQGASLRMLVEQQLKTHSYGCAGRIAIEVGGREVNRLDRGACLGEMALITGRPRSATVRALDDGKLLRVGSDDFERLLESRPEIAVGLLRTFGQRLRRATRKRIASRA